MEESDGERAVDLDRGPRGQTLLSVRHCGGHGGTCYSDDADRDYIVIRTCSQGRS
jgi:hypothetical protein